MHGIWELSVRLFNFPVNLQLAQNPFTFFTQPPQLLSPLTAVVLFSVSRSPGEGIKQNPHTDNSVVMATGKGACREAEEGKGAQTVAERDLTPGGERTMQCADSVLQSCALWF